MSTVTTPQGIQQLFAKEAELKAPEVTSTATKVCFACKQEKSLDDFKRQQNNRVDGRERSCIACREEATKLRLKAYQEAGVVDPILIRKVQEEFGFTKEVAVELARLGRIKMARFGSEDHTSTRFCRVSLMAYQNSLRPEVPEVEESTTPDAPAEIPALQKLQLALDLARRQQARGATDFVSGLEEGLLYAVQLLGGEG